MKIRQVALAAALIVSSLVEAAAADQRRINVVVQPEPPGLMLGLVQNATTLLVAGNIYEGLLRYSPELKPLPQLATSWEVADDKLTYTFHLRTDVKWHDGKSFTSDDVVFSADVFLRKTLARLRTSLEHVQSVSAPDPATVVFKLKQPFAPFLGIFDVTTMPMIPKHIYEGTDFSTNPANNAVIGTGPFKFKQWIKGSRIILVRNEDYYEKGKPQIEELVWHVIPDAATRAVAFETGVVDILPSGSVENFSVRRIASTKNSCLSEKGWEFLGPQSWLWLNNRGGPTADKRFRQAILYAMDRNFAQKAIWGGLGRVAVSPVRTTTRFFSDDVAKYEHDPKKAKALLAEMGYKGEPVRLLPLPYGETWQRWAEAVRQNLKDVGINVELVATDVAGWNQRLAEWDYDIAFTWLSQYGDPALGVSRTYLSTNIAKGSQFNNVAGYVNPRVDRLFADAATATSDADRQRLYADVQRILADDVPVAWLLELGFPTIHRCEIEGLFTSGLGLIDGFKDARVVK